MEPEPTGSRRSQLAELRPTPIDPAALREPTLQEIENIDCDENEREELMGQAAYAATAHRRQQLLERLVRRAGGRSLH